MELHKIGHSSVVVEEGSTKILTDPGVFTKKSALTELTDLTALIVTHSHGDHISESRVKLLRENNPELQIYTNAETGALLTEMGEEWTLLNDGDEIEIKDMAIKVWEVGHHPIHTKMPVVKNLAVLFNDAFFHPGDALFVPPVPVPVLGMPFGPFASIGECIDYGLSVKPGRIIPLHDGYMDENSPYKSLPKGFWEEAGITYEYLAAGETVEI